MDKKELEKIETKTDGKNAERFGTLLKKVVNIPKKEIQEQEARQKFHKKKTS